MTTKRSEIVRKSQKRTQSAMTLRVKNELFEIIQQRIDELEQTQMGYLRELVMSDLENNGFDVSKFREK